MTTLQDLLIYKSIAGEGGGSQITVEPLNATDNGIYDAGSGKAYNPVSVDVPEPTLISKSITENGTYNASSDNADGYSQVEVDVQPLEPDFNKVTLWDYEGTLLYQYSLEEIQQLTELPTPPAHEGLTFLEWNWTLQELKDENAPVIVGAIYNTSDNHTRIYLTFESAPPEAMPFGIKIVPSGGTITVDWGDGSEPTEVTEPQWLSHTWQLSTFPIEVCVDVSLDIEGTYTLGDYEHRSSDQRGLFNYNGWYTNRVTKVHLANNVVINAFNNLLNFCYNLEELVFSNANSVYNYCFVSPYVPLSIIYPHDYSNSGFIEHSVGFKLFSFGKSFRPSSFGNNVFNNDVKLLHINIPNSVTSLGINTFSSILNIKFVKIPSSITNLGNAFGANPQMLYYDFTDWTIANLQGCTFGNSIFNNITAGTQIIFATEAIANEAKQTTNLSTYASYITYVGAE